MGDYHVHLHPHGPYDGTGPEPGTFPRDHIEAYVSAALERGEDEVGFTGHLCRCVESTDVLGPFWEAPSNPDVEAMTRAFVAEDRTLSLARYVEAAPGQGRAEPRHWHAGSAKRRAARQYRSASA